MDTRGRPTRSLGLPEPVRACLFDLDGVLTQTAGVHRDAWKAAFDPVLAAHGRPPFTEADYLAHVDGKPRLTGVRDLLVARGLHELVDPPQPDGLAADVTDADPAMDTVRAIGARKNALLVDLLARDGVTVFPRSVAYLRAVRSAGLGTAAVTSSANGAAVLRAAGIDDLLDIRVDALVARDQGLAGKPAPDTFLAAARALGVGPDAAAVFEDSLAGVAAGRAGGFAFVVGIDQRVGTSPADRAEHAAALRANGADTVVSALSELMETDPMEGT